MLPTFFSGMEKLKSLSAPQLKGYVHSSKKLSKKTLGRLIYKCPCRGEVVLFCVFWVRHALGFLCRVVIVATKTAQQHAGSHYKICDIYFND